MICLRPHHGMCLAYFEGKGYSDGFTVNMQKMLEFFEKGADIELTVSGDAKSPFRTICVRTSHLQKPN